MVHILSRRCMKMPHDERPACKTHTNSISVFSTGRPMQLRTNRRPHAPAPSFVNLVKLRSKRHPICLSAGSSGNPVHLRITRVGQATCHQCEQIRRVVTASGLVGPFERRDETIVPANIEQTKKGHVSYLCYLNRILAAAPHVALAVSAHTPTQMRCVMRNSSPTMY